MSAASGAANVRAVNASARLGPLAEVLPAVGLAATLVTEVIEVYAGRLGIGGLLVFLPYLASPQRPSASWAA